MGSPIYSWSFAPCLRARCGSLGDRVSVAGDGVWASSARVLFEGRARGQPPASLSCAEPLPPRPAAGVVSVPGKTAATASTQSNRRHPRSGEPPLSPRARLGAASKSFPDRSRPRRPPTTIYRSFDALRVALGSTGFDVTHPRSLCAGVGDAPSRPLRPRRKANAPYWARHSVARPQILKIDPAIRVP
jgi:hypothetical protein